jgi:MoaA/NifB/PqqE/SkfB family radical SAM enzyme
MTLSILYRGPLSSCNYDCDYCPFAKRHDDREALEADRRSLARFVSWATDWRRDRLGILFTPWGEGLVRAWYREAFVALSKLPHLDRVAIQTNLSAPLAFLDRCDVARVALWCTYHPTQVARARFVARCHDLSRRGVRFSVGVVGTRENLGEIEAMRRELPRGTYLWVNAVRDIVPAYTTDETAFLAAIDPLFRRNLSPPPSLGAPCRAGESVISVDGDGNVRRCHFVREILGNLYEEGWEDALKPRRCPNAACTCHIGYVHRRDLDLYDVFEGGVLERIPGAVTFR